MSPDPRWIAVCSDVSAGDIDTDAFTAEIYDVGVPCVTDVNRIQSFLQERIQPMFIKTNGSTGATGWGRAR